MDHQSFLHVTVHDRNKDIIVEQFDHLGNQRHWLNLPILAIGKKATLQHVADMLTGKEAV